MVDTGQASEAVGLSRMIVQCVNFARAHGVGAFPPGVRVQPRLAFVHAVRYCLGSAPSSADTHPAFTLDISLDGLALWCREALPVGSVICARLPLADGRTVWLPGRVVYCRPDVEYYRVGLSFNIEADGDKHQTDKPKP